MNKKILMVDDDENILASFRRQLALRLDLYTANNAEDGLIVMEKYGPFAVVVSDFKMPGEDGICFLEKVKELAPDTVRIMLTGYADIDMAINAVNQGNIYRFMTKPCPINDFLPVINTALEQYRLICSERELLEQTLKGSIKLLIDILSISKPKEFNQLSRLRILAKNIALRLKVQNLWEVDLALMLSPIGIITIPENILQKIDSGNPLSPDEEQMFYSHPSTARNLLANIPRLENIAEAVGYQMKSGNCKEIHEGHDIPLLGHILKVILDFNSLMKKTWSIVYTLEHMENNKENYDPDVFSAFIYEVKGIKKLLEEGAGVKHISLNDISIGMILLDDLQDNNGLVLLSQGQEITPVLKQRLLNFAQNSCLHNKIRVLLPN